MSFTARAKDIEIVTFYEEKVMPPFKREVSRFFHPHRVISEEYPGIKTNEIPITSFQIVPRSNTRIGVPNEEMIPLAANHREMCRVEKGGLGFRKIVQVCQTHRAQSNEEDPTRRKCCARIIVITKLRLSLTSSQSSGERVS